MIAVFAKNLESFERLRNDLEMLPKEEFRYIREEENLVGIKFTGVIKGNQWYENNLAREAYDYLHIRQPELFRA